jgi:hypothetical protein
VPDFDAEPDHGVRGRGRERADLAVLDPLQPRGEEKEEATEYFIGYLMPRATACKKWDLDEEDLKGGTDDELEEVDDLIANAAGATELLGMTSLAGDRHESIGARVLVIEYYAKQCDDYKEGRHWIVVNKTDGDRGGAAPEGFWPPVVEIDDVPVPGDPHAMGLLGQVVPLNREYNSKNGKIAEHDVMMAMGGKWVVSMADKT